VSASDEVKSNGNPSPITITELPFFDVELIGVPALGYIGSQQLADNPSFQHLMEDDKSDEPKVVICGGKGGVGKSKLVFLGYLYQCAKADTSISCCCQLNSTEATTSSSLAVTMAAKGHNVALISTDPAHSLGDAIGMDLRGGKLIDCPLIGVPMASIGDGSLSVMEIDPSSALSEFKGIVDELIGGGDSGGSDLRGTLQDLESVFDTLPAGTDEVVALAKVVNLVKRGDFDRIVLDTAPTGHTLRMLSSPGFLADFIDRLLTISQKVNSNAAVKMFIASASGGNSEQLDAAASNAKSRILKFQFQMYDLEDLFSNPDQTEFLIVTVPTELAVRESVRLLNDLTFDAPDMPIKVRHIVVNQVLKDDESDTKTFLSHVSDGQSTSIQNLQQFLGTMTTTPRLTKVPYLDTEPRGVFGLKMLADELLREEEGS
jgi:arsenite-transporting ATPase